MSASGRVEQVEWAYGGNAPEWILVLAAECERSTQKAVAKRLGYSPATISMLLNGRYTTDLTAVERAVRGAFMRLTVDCPVCGEIPADVCQKHQKQPFAATNSARVRLYKSCHGGCPHSRDGKGA